MSSSHFTLTCESALLVMLLIFGAIAPLLSVSSTAESQVKDALLVDHYPSYAEMKSTLSGYCVNCSFMTFHDLGYTSWQGRELYAIEVSDDGSNDTEPKALVMGSHHGDERVSAVVPYYFLQYIYMNYGTDSNVTSLVNSIDIWVISTVNPDGYEADTRKNGRDNGDGTIGVDVNRNYWYHWGNNAGTETYQDTYHGPYPFSEPESRSVRDLASTIHFNISVSYHSYGAIFVHPWGYSYNEKAADNELMQNMAHYGASFLGYQYGQSSDPSIGMYTADGDSDDWLYGNESTLAFTVEIGRKMKNPPVSDLQGICEAQTNMLMHFLWLAKKPYSCLYSGIEGYILDQDLQPIANATIKAEGPRMNGAAVSDEDGRFKIPLLSGQYNLTVGAKGFYTYHKTYNVTTSDYIMEYIVLDKPNSSAFHVQLSSLNVSSDGSALSDGSSVMPGDNITVSAQFTPELNNITAHLVLYSGSRNAFPMDYRGSGIYETVFSTQGMESGEYDLNVNYSVGGKSYPDGYRPGPDFSFVIPEKNDITVEKVYGINGEAFTVCNQSENPEVHIYAIVSGSPHIVTLSVKHAGENDSTLDANMVSVGNGLYSAVINVSGFGEGLYCVDVTALDSNGHGDTNGSNASGCDYSFRVISGCKLDTNSAPVLYDFQVTPQSGDLDTEFKFSVKYTDDDGDEPQLFYIWIDQKAIAVTPSKISDGVWQAEYSTKLSEGDHEIWFSASDGSVSDIVQTEKKKVTVKGRMPLKQVSDPTSTSGTVVIVVIVSLLVISVVYLFYARYRKSFK